MKSYRILILSGGSAASPLERNHSLKYGTYVNRILLQIGHRTYFQKEINKSLFSTIEKLRPDIIFNTLLGKNSEDGKLQALFEFLGIPYTGCSHFASLVSNRKFLSKQFAYINSINIPHAILVNYSNWMQKSTKKKKIDNYNYILKKIRRVAENEFPLFVKPNVGCFGFGSSKVNNENELLEAIHEAGNFDNNVIVEKYIEGTDAFVSILNGKPFSAIEKQPLTSNKTNFELEHLLTKNSIYYVPGRFNIKTQKELKHKAEKIYNIIECQGLCRVDFRVTNEDDVFFLELNSQHTIRPKSIALSSAKYEGLTAEQLVMEIIEHGISRFNDKSILWKK